MERFDRTDDGQRVGKSIEVEVLYVHSCDRVRYVAVARKREQIYTTGRGGTTEKDGTSNTTPTML